jgi:hypothetical protein
MHEYRLPSLNDPSRPKTPRDKNIPANVSILHSAFSSSTEVQKINIRAAFFSHTLLLSNRMHGLFAGYLKSLILWHKECYLTPGVLNQLQQQSQSCYLLCSPYKLPILHWKAPPAQQIDSTANSVCRDNSSRILTIHRTALHVKS